MALRADVPPISRLPRLCRSLTATSCALEFCGAGTLTPAAGGYATLRLSCPDSAGCPRSGPWLDALPNGRADSGVCHSPRSWQTAREIPSSSRGGAVAGFRADAPGYPADSSWGGKICSRPWWGAPYTSTGLCCGIEEQEQNRFCESRAVGTIGCCGNDRVGRC